MWILQALVCCVDLLVPHLLTCVRGTTCFLHPVMGLILQIDGFCLMLGSVALHCPWSPLGQRVICSWQSGWDLQDQELNAVQLTLLWGVNSRFTEPRLAWHTFPEGNFPVWRLLCAASSNSIPVSQSFISLPVLLMSFWATSARREAEGDSAAMFWDTTEQEPLLFALTEAAQKGACYQVGKGWGVDTSKSAGQTLLTLLCRKSGQRHAA